MPAFSLQQVPWSNYLPSNRRRLFELLQFPGSDLDLRDSQSRREYYVVQSKSTPSTWALSAPIELAIGAKMSRRNKAPCQIQRRSWRQVSHSSPAWNRKITGTAFIKVHGKRFESLPTYLPTEQTQENNNSESMNG